MIRVGFALVLGSCTGGAPAPAADGADPVLAAGQGVVVRASDVTAALALMPASQRAAYATPEGRRQLLDEIVRRELLVAEARRRGVDRSLDVRRATQQALIHALRGKDFFARRREIVITDDEIRAYFEAHPELYRRPVQREVAHVLCATREACERVVAALAGEDPTGERFQYLALVHSEDEDTRERGGVLGWFGADDQAMAAPLREAAFAIRGVPGVAGPVRTERGWHVVRAGAWRDAKTLTLDQARDDVRARIEREKWEAFVDATDAKLLAGKRIEIFESRLAYVHVAPPAEGKTP